MNCLPLLKKNAKMSSLHVNSSRYNLNLERICKGWLIKLEIDCRVPSCRFEFDKAIKIVEVMNEKMERIDYNRDEDILCVDANKIYIEYRLEGFLFLAKPALNIPYPENREFGYELSVEINNFDEIIFNNASNIYNLIIIDKGLIRSEVCEIRNNILIKSKLSKQLNGKLINFLQFYNYFSDSQLNVRVYEANVEYALGLSYPGLILLNTKIFKNQLFMLYKYLIHELVHQYIGLKLKFSNELLCESITEFMQLLYIRECFDDNVYKAYKKSYVRAVELCNDEHLFNKGVLVWEYIFDFHMQNKMNLRNLFIYLYGLKKEITMELMNQLLKEQYNIDYLALLRGCNNKILNVN